MQDPTFLGGAIALANESQMGFLASPRGLVAIQDIGGARCAALNLTNRQAQIAADIISRSYSVQMFVLLAQTI